MCRYVYVCCFRVSGYTYHRLLHTTFFASSTWTCHGTWEGLKMYRPRAYIILFSVFSALCFAFFIFHLYILFLSQQAKFIKESWALESLFSFSFSLFLSSCFLHSMLRIIFLLFLLFYVCQPIWYTSLPPSLTSYILTLRSKLDDEIIYIDDVNDEDEMNWLDF